jgi:hypothetical protein
MGDMLIQVRDPTRLHCLVMPSPRAPSGGPPAVCFPWPSAPPLQHAVAPSHCLGPAMGGARGIMHQPQPPPPMQEEDHTGAGFSVTIPGWTTPAGYAVCGLSLCLCNLVAPAYIQSCCHVFAPVWSLAVALHIIANPGNQDGAWMWGGVMTILLLPFVVLVASPLFVGFYLVVFAVFSSGGLFWRRLHGASFILAWLCWGGLLLSGAMSVGVGIPPQMHLCVAAFFSLSLGVLNSGGAKFAMRVGSGT